MMVADDMTNNMIKACDDSFACSLVRNVMFSDWLGHLEVDHAKFMQQLITKTAQEGDLPVGILTNVREGAPMIPSASQKDLLDVYRKPGTQLKNVAIVFEGSTLMSVGRVFMNAIAIATRSKFRFRIFTDIGSACRWLAKDLSIDATEFHNDVLSCKLDWDQRRRKGETPASFFAENTSAG